MNLDKGKTIQGFLIPDGHEKPLEGIFIPGEEVNLYAVPPKRKEVFLVVYPDLLRELGGSEIETFLTLLMLADYRNRVNASLSDLCKVFNVTNKGVLWRLRPLRGKAIKGRLPLLFLNPFYGSKCKAYILDGIREEWENVAE